MIIILRIGSLMRKIFMDMSRSAEFLAIEVQSLVLSCVWFMDQVGGLDSSHFLGQDESISCLG